MSQQPSFILFIADQLRADNLGCYGHPLARTPHIDAIAVDGLTFDRFYVASPVCMPNRVSLMTGRMPSISGVRENGVPMAQDYVSFVDLLRDAGYQTALCGKSHLQNFTGNPPVAPAKQRKDGFRLPPKELRSARRINLDDPVYDQEDPSYWADPQAAVQTPFYGFDHVDLVVGHGDNLGGNYRQWLLQRNPDAMSLIGPENQLPHDYTCPQAVRTAVPEELYSTTYIAECAADWLKRLDPERPFFLMVSFPDPHHPFNPPGRYWDMFSPDDMPVPEAFHRKDWDAPPHVQQLFQDRAAGRSNLAGMGTFGCSAREAQEAQALTLGMLAMIDDAVGQVMQALKDSGRDGNTTIMFTSDHGDNLGDHGLLLKGPEAYEPVIRVPFLWRAPEERGCGMRTQRIGQTLDIGACILEKARIEPFDGFQGRSLFGPEERKAALVQYDHQRPLTALAGPPRVHSLRTDRYRLSIFHGQDWGELYDLQLDPGEFVNRWDHPEFAAIRAGLIEQMLRLEIDAIDRAPRPTRQA